MARPRKIPKKCPSGRNSGTPRKYPQNAEKVPKMGIFGIFWGIVLGIFSGILGVNAGSPESRAEELQPFQTESFSR